MIERRVESLPIEIEERANGQPRIRGTAVAYNTFSKDLGGFREVILPGAFDHLIDQRRKDAAEVVALFNHDPSQLLGRTSAKTLRLWSDDTGLHYEIDPVPNTSLGRDLVEHLRLGNVRGSSFAFTVAEEKGGEDENGYPVRYVHKAAGLYDVSPVVNPAYDATTVNVRSMQEYIAAKAAAEAPAAPNEPLPLTAADRLNVAKARAMAWRAARLVVVALAVVLMCSDAHAWGRRRSSGYSSYGAVPAGCSNSTAQGVAEIQARLGRVGHYGGNTGYEGCGSGPTPESALANCCYSNSGMAVVDQGTAYGHGRWFACKRYR